MDFFGANLDIVIMILFPISKKMKLIHSVINIGGSLTIPGNLVVRLIGMATTAVLIFISDQSIDANLNIDVHFVKDIQLVRSEADFDGLKFKPIKKYLDASFVLLPRFLTKVAIEIDDHSLLTLSTDTIVAMVDFEVLLSRRCILDDQD